MDLIYRVTIDGDVIEINVGPAGFCNFEDGAVAFHDGNKVLNIFAPGTWEEVQLIKNEANN